MTVISHVRATTDLLQENRPYTFKMSWRGPTVTVPTPTEPRWQQRLRALTLPETVGIDEEIVNPELTETARGILTLIDDLGFDSSVLRIFISADGHYQIEHERPGKRFRTLEISAQSRLSLYDEDLSDNTAHEWSVERRVTAAIALLSD